jgi:SAM-dependent methyltransferase
MGSGTGARGIARAKFLEIVASVKVRDSGMPEQTYWESLFNIGTILDGLQVGEQIHDAVEVGCGYGTFTLPVAQRIQGILHTFDIEPEMIEITRARAASEKIQNVRVGLRDVIVNGFGLPANSADAVLLFNILHADNPEALLRVAADVTRPGGRILAIHWRSDIPTPRGPALSIRPRPDQIVGWAASVGLRSEPSQLFPPWHFGMALHR